MGKKRNPFKRAASFVARAVADPVAKVKSYYQAGREFYKGPAGQLALTAGATALGVPPPVTAGVLKTVNPQASQQAINAGARLGGFLSQPPGQEGGFTPPDPSGLSSLFQRFNSMRQPPAAAARPAVAPVNRRALLWGA